MKNITELRIVIDHDNKTYSILNESSSLDDSGRYVLSEGYLCSSLFFNYSDYSKDKSNPSVLDIAGVLSSVLSGGEEDLDLLDELEEVDILEDVDTPDPESNIHIY